MKLLFSIWLLVSLVAVAGLLGPWRGILEGARNDALLAEVRLANDAAMIEGNSADLKARWEKVHVLCETALKPPPQSQQARLELEILRARALHRGGKAPQALTELNRLAGETKSQAVSPALKETIDAELAAVNYHIAWMLREQSPEGKQWRVFSNVAIAKFRALAEKAGDSPQRAEYVANLSCAMHFQHEQAPSEQGLSFPSNIARTEDCRAQLEREMRKANPPPSTNPRPVDDREELREQATEDAKSGKTPGR